MVGHEAAILEARWWISGSYAVGVGRGKRRMLRLKRGESLNGDCDFALTVDWQ
jgi:hypothetical protein